MVNQPYKHDQLSVALWQACQAMKPLSSQQHQNCCLAVLFLKYISDLWKSQQRKYEALYGVNAEIVRRKMSRSRFLLPDRGTFDFLYQHRHDADICEKMDNVLMQIEQLNPEKLAGLFQDIRFNNDSLGPLLERNKKLRKVLTDFADPIFTFESDSEAIATASKSLIEKFTQLVDTASGGFATPPEVSDLLSQLLLPEQGSRIYDPASGTATLLAAMTQHITDSNTLKRSADFALYGHEPNRHTWVQAKLFMFLQKLDATRLMYGHCISGPHFLERGHRLRFEVVVSNLLASRGTWTDEAATMNPYSRFERGRPPRTKGDYAFILHMLKSTTPQGKMAVIVSPRALFRTGVEGQIRRKLIEENLLDTVIGLPANLLPGSNIPIAILIFSTCRTTRDVLFVDASQECRRAKKQATLRLQDIAKIVDTYRNSTTIYSYSRRVPPEEIQQNDFNLSLSRYIKRYEISKLPDTSSAQQELDVLEKKLHYVKTTLDERLHNTKYFNQA